MVAKTNWQNGDQVTATALNDLGTEVNSKPTLTGGKLDPAVLPDLAIVDFLGSVASQSAMLALTGQKGDWTIRTDTSTVWVITGSTPSQVGSWTQLAYPASSGSSGPVTPRVVQQAFASTITPNASTTDVLVVGTLTGNITVANPSGTPVDGQIMRLRFTQDTTGGRTITWGGAYAFTDNVTTASAPTTANKKFTVMLSYDAADAKWVVLALVPR